MTNQNKINQNEITGLVCMNCYKPLYNYFYKTNDWYYSNSNYTTPIHFTCKSEK
jgi:hypothetical protein